MKPKIPHIHRRDFLKKGAGAAAALATTGALQAKPSKTGRIPLGLDAHSVRGMKWKAPQLIEYAAEIKADALLLNTPNYYESLDDSYLKKVRKLADANDIRIYTGAGSIAERSVTYNADKQESPEKTLELGIRLATTLGSPVVNFRIGMISDRYMDGGIEAHMEDVIKVLRWGRSRAQDANIKFAFENHAGDLRSEEILTIIKEAGPDICGSMLDPGNGLWALEDPMKQIQILGPHVLCTSIRDYMVWESEGGATFQWTRIGNGLMDPPAFANHLATLAPGVPFFVETISNSARPLPFLTDEHMAGFPKLKAEGLLDFLRLLRRGKPLELAMPPAGMDQREFDQKHQKEELLKSFKYLRKHCNCGIKKA
ncbi:MAG: sugar phosphate isomerase/epimerase family protein [Puniceicoccaceae bacterium]